MRAPQPIKRISAGGSAPVTAARLFKVSFEMSATDQPPVRSGRMMMEPLWAIPDTRNPPSP